jgi:hypothetical protein
VEILRDPDGPRRHPDADYEILDRAEFVRQICGDRVRAPRVTAVCACVAVSREMPVQPLFGHRPSCRLRRTLAACKNHVHLVDESVLRQVEGEHWLDGFEIVGVRRHHGVEMAAETANGIEFRFVELDLGEATAFRIPCPLAFETSPLSRSTGTGA